LDWGGSCGVGWLVGPVTPFPCRTELELSVFPLSVGGLGRVATPRCSICFGFSTQLLPTPLFLCRFFFLFFPLVVVLSPQQITCGLPNLFPLLAKAHLFSSITFLFWLYGGSSTCPSTCPRVPFATALSSLPPIFLSTQIAPHPPSDASAFLFWFLFSSFFPPLTYCSAAARGSPGALCGRLRQLAGVPWSFFLPLSLSSFLLPPLCPGCFEILCFRHAQDGAFQTQPSFF